MLLFQERIQGLENAPIARFDGLGCYQTRSEMSDDFGARTAAKTGWQTGFGQAPMKSESGGEAGLNFRATNASLTQRRESAFQFDETGFSSAKPLAGRRRAIQKSNLNGRQFHQAAPCQNGAFGHQESRCIFREMGIGKMFRQQFESEKSSDEEMMVKQFSRHMPPREGYQNTPERKSWLKHFMAWLYLAFMLCMLLLNLWIHPVATWAFLTVLILLTWCLAEVESKRLRALAASRAGEDIGQFARQARCRENDPWVVRAVYEELAHQTARFAKAADFPVRWDDDIWQTLQLDEDDINDEYLPVMAWRAGRSLDKTRENPWAGKVKTAGDLVLFLNAQPRLAR